MGMNLQFNGLTTVTPAAEIGIVDQSIGRTGNNIIAQQQTPPIDTARSIPEGASITVRELIDASKEFDHHNQKLIMSLLKMVLANRSDDACQIVDAELTALDAALPDIKEDPNDDRMMKVVTKLVHSLLVRLGITVNNANVTDIARLIAYITGYGKEHIRKELNSLRLTKAHEKSINLVNTMLENVSSEIRIDYKG